MPWLRSSSFHAQPVRLEKYTIMLEEIGSHGSIIFKNEQAAAGLQSSPAFPLLRDQH
ncbi:hypothetical protein K438DRAFT_1838370 [Mycena galopus ATCC 62051]|nr:hypothetical protein K438DRAFT_1838370 [Mycena galopus ATCC 62051]